MEINTISGLPAHVLIVHAVVVLVPLAAAFTVVAALSPAARRHLGLFFVGFTLVATVSVPLAVQSGEALEKQLPDTKLLATHTGLGESLTPWAAALGLSLLLLVALDVYRRTVVAAGREDMSVNRVERRLTGLLPAAARRPGERRWLRPLAAVAVGLALITSAGSLVTVVRIGDSGARAAWAQRPDLAPVGSPAGTQRE